MVTQYRSLLSLMTLVGVAILAACGNNPALEGEWRIVQIRLNGQPATSSAIGSSITVTPSQVTNTSGAETKVSTRQGTTLISPTGARGTLSLQSGYLVITEISSNVRIDIFCERTY